MGALLSQSSGQRNARLMRTLQILLGRPVLKTDIVYTTEAVGTEFHSTVTFPQYDPSASHRGTPAPSGKQAPPVCRVLGTLC